MPIYKVSVLGKTTKKLVPVTEVIADGYQLGTVDELPIFARDGVIRFYNWNDNGWFRKKTLQLVASLPSSENWVVEQV